MLHGAYRRVVSAVKDLAWEQLLYDDKTAQLTVSDLERVRGTVPAMPQGERFRALRLEFSLKSSQYATMVLREVLKIDTSSAFQASLTAANKEVAAEPSASAGPSAQSD